MDRKRAHYDGLEICYCQQCGKYWRSGCWDGTSEEDVNSLNIDTKPKIFLHDKNCRISKLCLALGICFDTCKIPLQNAFDDNDLEISQMKMALETLKMTLFGFCFPQHFGWVPLYESTRHDDGTKSCMWRQLSEIVFIQYKRRHNIFSHRQKHGRIYGSSESIDRQLVQELTVDKKLNHRQV